MRHFLFLSLIFLFCFKTGISQTPSLSKTKVSDKITMLIADNLLDITSEAAAKFKTARAPLGAYSTEDQLVDLVVNYSNTSWGKNDIELMKSFYKSTISGLYTDVVYETDGVMSINGREFAVFEFVALVKPPEGSFIQKSGQKYYNYIMYTILGGRAYVFNFSCPDQIRNKWESIAKEMMSSVEIKK